MSAHRARHRAPAGSPTAATQRSARELIDELTRAQAAPARTRDRAAQYPAAQYPATQYPAAQYPAAPARAAHLPTPRKPRAAMSSTTLTMLAVGAVGASTAMTGAFAAITDETPAPNAPEPATAVPVAMDDVLVPATSPDDSALRFSSATISTAKPSSERIADTSGAGTVLADDIQQTNAREIAALARSVDRERAVGGVTGAATKSIGGLGVPAALGVDKAVDLVPGAAMRASAMNAALGKIGVPYVWGAVGPKAFDCSGLVLWSFNKVGISLPRTSRAQSQVGKPVKKSELRPGDLVFFYTPVSHVGIYIGNGKFVHASEPGKPVKISPLNRFPFHNARRL